MRDEFQSTAQRSRSPKDSNVELPREKNSFGEARAYGRLPTTIPAPLTKPSFRTTRFSTSERLLLSRYRGHQRAKSVCPRNSGANTESTKAEHCRYEGSYSNRMHTKNSAWAKPTSPSAIKCIYRTPESCLLSTDDAERLRVECLRVPNAYFDDPSYFNRQGRVALPELGCFHSVWQVRV